MRFFENRSNPRRAGRCTLLSVDTCNGTDTRPDEVARLVLTTARGREVGVYLNAAELQRLKQALTDIEDG